MEKIRLYRHIHIAHRKGCSTSVNVQFSPDLAGD